MYQRDPQTNSRTRHQPRTLLRFGVVLALVMAGAALWGIGTRHQADAALKSATETAAVPAVAVTVPKAGAAASDLVLPGTSQAYVDAPIYARTSGYLKSWKTDIGTKVHKGEVLAEIDTPEVTDQLRQAEADLTTAEANQTIARSTAERWKTLVATDSVTRQETDEKIADAKAKDAVVASARANVARLREVLGFARVIAPFDGVVSARKTDVGALINAGSGQGIELFHLVDQSILRIYVQVPQIYASAIRPGLMASLRVAEYPGRDFPAKLAHSADAIDAAARTLLVEFQVDNAKGELLPGGYAEVHFSVPAKVAALRLPVNTLIFRGDGIKVARLGADGKVAMVSVLIGRDFGSEIEVVHGLEADDRIILSPPDSLEDGQTVRVVADHAKGA